MRQYVKTSPTLTGHSFEASQAIMMNSCSFESHLFALNLKNSLAALLRYVILAQTIPIYYCICPFKSKITKKISVKKYCWKTNFSLEMSLFFFCLLFLWKYRPRKIYPGQWFRWKSPTGKTKWWSRYANSKRQQRFSKMDFDSSWPSLQGTVFEKKLPE